MKTAIRDNDPVFVMENTILYGQTWEVPEEEYLIPMGKANILKEGKDLSLIAHGRAAITALEAAGKLAEDHDIDAEVLDLRSIRPLDVEAIIATVKKTNRVVYVEENKPFASVGSQITSIIQEEAFDHLDAPVKRVSSIDAPQIYSMPLEDIQIPDANRRGQESAGNLLGQNPFTLQRRTEVVGTSVFFCQTTLDCVFKPGEPLLKVFLGRDACPQASTFHPVDQQDAADG